MLLAVSYSDDPHQRVFRTVYPSPGEPDSVLDGPALETDPATNRLRVMRKQDGTPYAWDEFGIPDVARARRVEKLASLAGRKRGTPWTPASEPVVYYINYASLTDAQKQTADTFIAANRSWMNFVDLGSGVAATLAAQCVAPCWIVVVDGNPGRGTQLRTRSVSTHTVGVWELTA